MYQKDNNNYEMKNETDNHINNKEKTNSLNADGENVFFVPKELIKVFNGIYNDIKEANNEFIRVGEALKN